MPAPKDPEHYERWVQQMRERKLTSEHRAKIGQGVKRFYEEGDSEQVARVRAQNAKNGRTVFKGKKHTKATKAKMRRAALKRWSNPEERARQSKRIAQAYADGKLPEAGNSHSGYFQSAKLGVIIFYRSSWELEVLKKLEIDPTVVHFCTEPEIVEYEYGGAICIYIPDIYVEYEDGSWEIIEVKPSCFVNNPDVQAKFKAARAVYGDNFMVLTELEIFG